MDPSNDAPDAFSERVAGVLHAELGAPVALSAMRRLAGGQSWETFTVDVTTDGASPARTVVIKRQPVTGISGSYDVNREVAFLRTAADLGVPVPAVLASALPDETTRGFYVMEAVEGVVPHPRDVKSVIPDPLARESLGRQLAVIMARLHSADVTALPLLSDLPMVDGAKTGTEETGHWARVYRENTRIRIPVLDLAIEWLSARADHVSGRVALVHNDLRVGNVIVRDGQVAAILDWETTHFSDPVADIAWFGLPSFRGRSPLAGRLLPMTAYLDEYENATGWRPSARSLTYWTVLSLAKTAISYVQALQAFTDGQSQDVRYANMSHSVYYMLGWLVDMLAAGEWGH